MTILKYTVQLIVLAVIILVLASFLDAAVDWVARNCNNLWISKCAWALVAASFLIALRKFWLNNDKE